MEEEWLDQVDDADVVVGRKLRSDFMRENDRHYRAIGLYIRNSDGKLWIPRRTAHKIIFPLALDLSCAGHVASGETYEEALHREVAEELNMELAGFDVRTIGSQTPQEGFSCFGMIYEISSDTVPSYNPDDFIESYWLTPQEILEMDARGEPMKSDMPKQMRKFYAERLNIVA